MRDAETSDISNRESAASDKFSLSLSRRISESKTKSSSTLLDSFPRTSIASETVRGHISSTSEELSTASSLEREIKPSNFSILEELKETSSTVVSGADSSDFTPEVTRIVTPFSIRGLVINSVLLSSSERADS